MNNQALFSYNEGFKEWITAYKFKGDYRLAGAFATELKRQLQTYPQYIICPMPLSSERFKSRGFNQVSSCLASSGCAYQLILNRKETAPQSEKTRSERLKMPQPFSLNQPIEKIRNQKVLLVDDVYTTGRTLFHGAELLYKNGAKVVNSLTFAR
ncbi:ComF family protein [Enterococcus hermanniensis]|uniref:Competence protein CoiA n=1 Tax=Enterococcus hermanniensis TaxID=249189 RepID=A0A1L8TNQ7_9ENTE|nr:phosphoribosyltransferase family protein [Enterococcus hermanniensis]OJG45853.1 competence protein CoiA [Enterococcus hermanniensis]